MDYKTMRDRIEDMAKDNHKDFVKAVISMEKGINDESALDKLYEAYMDNDSLNLLHEEFDYMIEDLREQGQIKDLPYVQEEKDNLVNIVGNIVGKVDVVERENKNGEAFQVVNFSVASKDDEGNKVYHNCSAYGEKGDIPKDFKQGDFVKLFGQLRTSIDDNGKEHSNVRIFSSKLLKAKEQMKEQDKSQEIAKLKSEIEEREKDLFYADSWEQSGQIRADIEEMKAKLNTLIGSEKGKENDKKSILGAIKEYQAEDKEKPDEKHSIQYELNLEDKTWTQYIDDTPIRVESFDLDDEGENAALRNMKDEIDLSSFSDLVYVDSEYLRAAVGLNIDNKGNFYDPLSKDTDNDGIPDRYDNAFQDSDYFESTYDVEDNLHAKKEQEKPSISAQIQKYQQEEKANERRHCTSEERNDELSR